ncbi:MAG: pyruvate, phosphate dikinase [candidate division Zixibacteria bacterium]|nr:pyruvate, phosphate dikinase [candidate division Zixibacteria bacterium]
MAKSTKASKSTKSGKTAKKVNSKAHPKMIYFFGGGKAEGKGDMKDLLGGKGAGLAEMTNINIPVPPGFTITTDTCHMYYEADMSLPTWFEKDMKTYLTKMEKIMGSKFGDPKNPLLVSVRSGAKFSMPGMMDTVLNLGLNDETLAGFIEKTKNPRFGYDNYRRFISMFGNVVLGIDKDAFEEVIEKKKKEKKIKKDSSLQVGDLEDIVKQFKKIIKKKTGEEFPEDPYVQLALSRDAVFRSWNNPRAISYRRLNNIPSNLGTAVNVQAMVYGNMGNTSGTGVGFTRDPGSGEKVFYGEYLLNAQGEDVVAGIRTPSPIINLKKDMPDVFKQLKDITDRLEAHYRDVQDFEFTIQEGTLYMLQTRSGKRTVQAALKIATDMVKEGLLSKEEAVMRIEAPQLDHLLHPRLDPKAKYKAVAKGLAASPGAGSGQAVFTAEDAVKLSSKKKCILVRQETNPDDIEGMNAAAGILTSRGGMTSHAAVVARGMGKPCVAGCEQIRVDEKKKQFQIGKLIIKEGEIITINGSTGEVIIGLVPTIDPELSGEFAELMKWADEYRRLGVRTNADSPKDSLKAISFGAEGIGLCRTEHMFFSEERLPIVQEMILAETTVDRQAALDKLLPFQRNDFKKIFEAMNGLPVTIRTLDPPLHEFLPNKEDVEARIDLLDKNSEDYDDQLASINLMLTRIDDLHEMNPMLGHRGCRLGIVYPEITEMQVRAIIEAACEVTKKGKKVFPEIMIPLIGHINEYKNQKEVAERIANEVISRRKAKVKYMIGTMIEIPRAALTADEISVEAEFFSFGTNDLTQMAMGFSRDDAGKFLTYYTDKGILPQDPFVTLDATGVGQLVRMGIEKGRSTNPKLKVGICGEHGGDPESILFFHKVGLDYVSCSPFRVPIARLVAAQATLMEKDSLAKPTKRKKAAKKTAAKKPAQKAAAKKPAKKKAKK